jgi:hypothetical protein
MNAIASFRLCTLTDDELLEKVDKAVDLIYKEGEIPSRHIPAQPNNDFDLLIGELILRFFKTKTVKPCAGNWIPFDFMNLETRPKDYGKYLICRKDGKIHWETWNGSGWAYNHNEVRFYAEIIPPKN